MTDLELVKALHKLLRRRTINFRIARPNSTEDFDGVEIMAVLLDHKGVILFGFDAELQEKYAKMNTG